MRRRPRRSPRLPLRHLPLRPYSRVDLVHGRRVRPGLRSLAGSASGRWRSWPSSLQALPEDPILAPAGPLAADQAAVALVEGWRGEICHVAVTGGDGRFACYKVVDPSLHNWFGLAMALRNQQISDFPLCNKSFNLSYCGHDL